MLAMKKLNNSYNNGEVIELGDFSPESKKFNKDSFSPLNTYEFIEDTKKKVRDHISSESNDGDGNMNEILNKYIDKLDRDQIALREDIRELNRNNRESTKTSEERITKLIEKSIQTTENNIRILEIKIDESHKKIDENNKYISNIAITTIIGIAAMVIAVIIALFVALYFN